MLENIKIILDLEDDKYDLKISLYINKYTNLILDYCNLKELNSALESFVEDKVVVILKETILNKNSDEVSENRGVKSISRGGFSVTYNVSEAKSTNELYSISLNDDDKKILKRFIKTVMW